MKFSFQTFKTAISFDLFLSWFNFSGFFFSLLFVWFWVLLHEAAITGSEIKTPPP
ncbi:hypothetical protein [Mycoplasmopsis agalactiae]|uniref:hypothetical protein n=1 Tax=Mycoplasmopsis agalactiae TaxID=2110 RepID=UPI002F41BD2B